MDVDRRCASGVPHLYVAVVDENGLVIDDGGEAVRPWIGRHVTELPSSVTVVSGIDPRLVLGLDIADSSQSPSNDEDQL